MTDTNKRSIAKSVTYRIISIVYTFFVVYIYTTNFTKSLEVTTVGTVGAVIIYYWHERGWNLTKWGIKDEKTDEDRKANTNEGDQESTP